MAAAGSQLIGWDVWAEKLKVLVTDLPKVAAKRCTMAALGVIKKALVERTKSASVPQRIRSVAVRSIGISTAAARRAPGQYAARVGYGIGKGFWKPIGRQAVTPESITDWFGERAVYRRYGARRAKKLKTPLWQTIRGNLRVKSSKRFLRLPGAINRQKTRMAKAFAKKLSPKRSKGVRLKRLRGVGMTKRNIHWAVFGTGVRTVKNWRGTGRSKAVGRMQPYLLGILAGVVRRNAKKAYEAAYLQLGKILVEAAGRRLSKVA